MSSAPPTQSSIKDFMEYFIHEQEPGNRKTTYIELDLNRETFESNMTSFLNGSIKLISGKKGVSHVHPKDQYNKKIGREISKSKAIDTLFKITLITADKESIVMYVDDEQSYTYRVEKFKKTGNIIII